MWENSRAIRESAEFQINFKPLSPVKAKPHNSSPAVISSSSLPCHPLFFQLRRRRFPARRERPKPTAKNNRQPPPREARIPRTSTSSVRSSVGTGLRTMLINGRWLSNSESWHEILCVRQSSRDHTVWWSERVTHGRCPILKPSGLFCSRRFILYSYISSKNPDRRLSRRPFSRNLPLFWQMSEITKTGL